MKNIIIILGIILILLGGAYWYTQRDTGEPVPTEPENVVGNADGVVELPDPVVELPDPEPVDETKTVIGSSVEGRELVAYHYGTGDTELLFIGGFHGAYSWNTVLVARELMDYLEANPTAIPENVRVTVVPLMNPDGLNKVLGSTENFEASDVTASLEETIPGRFNAHTVDLNRNFDCEWSAEGTWQNKQVSGGSAPFSEPESQALKQYVDANTPDAVVVWYSAVGGVFASNCRNGVLAETSALTNVYADASGYPAYEVFNYYDITGDAVNWFAKNNVPAISVLLTTHDSVEWSRNRAGISAVLDYYGE